MSMEKLERLLPTDAAKLTAGIASVVIPAAWAFLPSVLELMPLSLAADMLLTKLATSLALLSIALLIMLSSVIRSHNRLSIELQDAQFGEFLRKPLGGNR